MQPINRHAALGCRAQQARGMHHSRASWRGSGLLCHLQLLAMPAQRHLQYVNIPVAEPPRAVRVEQRLQRAPGVQLVGQLIQVSTCEC